MSLTPGAGTLALADNTNRGVFFHLALPVPVRVWTGRAPIPVAANALDPQREIYSGVGAPSGLPELDRMLQGDRQRVTIKLSGLNEQVVSIIDSAFADLNQNGVHARFGHMRYDRLWRPLHVIRWVWDGRLDEVSIESTFEEDSQLWAVDLSMSTALVDANRPVLQFWTPQAARNGDRAFDFVPRYTADSTRVWPPR